MWLKTLIGMTIGLVLNISLMLNVVIVFPLPRDVALLIGYIVGFVLWAGFIAYFYCFETIRKPLLMLMPVLIVSGVVNAMGLTGIIGAIR